MTPRAGQGNWREQAILSTLTTETTVPTRLYKIVGTNGESVHGGFGRWHLPTRKAPGKWMDPIKGDVRACRNGYHLVSAAGLLEWLPGGGGLLCEAEGRGDSDCDDGKKTAFREARILRVVGPLNDLTMWLAATDFAWRVLPHFERERPNDDRPRKAIVAARNFARGKIDAAAWATASSAARDAAWAAAWAAARVSASAAASDAAWATVSAAASDAAWAAARAAASDAAWDAARATAWAAARAAVHAAASDAAWDAEMTWQARRLLKIVSRHAT